MIGAVHETVQRADSLRAVLDSVFAGPSYRWVEVARPEGPLGRAWRELVRWLDDLQRRNPSAVGALFWMLVAALALILAHAAWVAFITMRGAAATSDHDPSPNAKVRDAVWYERETQRLAGAGQFTEAMQADFVRLMLELDARQVLHFHPSKTPGELASQASLGDARESLRDLVRTLYRFAFARDSCGPADFASWRARTNADLYAPSH